MRAAATAAIADSTAVAVATRTQEIVRDNGYYISSNFCARAPRILLLDRYPFIRPPAEQREQAKNYFAQFQDPEKQEDLERDLELARRNLISRINDEVDRTLPFDPDKAREIVKELEEAIGFNLPFSSEYAISMRAKEGKSIPAAVRMEECPLNVVGGRVDVGPRIGEETSKTGQWENRMLTPILDGTYLKKGNLPHITATCDPRFKPVETMAIISLDLHWYCLQLARDPSCKEKLSGQDLGCGAVPSERNGLPERPSLGILRVLSEIQFDVLYVCGYDIQVLDLVGQKAQQALGITESPRPEYLLNPWIPSDFLSKCLPNTSHFFASRHPSSLFREFPKVLNLQG